MKMKHGEKNAKSLAKHQVALTNNNLLLAAVDTD